MKRNLFFSCTHSQQVWRSAQKNRNDFRKFDAPKSEQKLFCTKQFEFWTNEAIFLNCALNWSFNDVYRRILISHTLGLTTKHNQYIYLCVHVTRRTRYYISQRYSVLFKASDHYHSVLCTLYAHSLYRSDV